jgi:hypothetical protein
VRENIRNKDIKLVAFVGTFICKIERSLYVSITKRRRKKLEKDQKSKTVGKEEAKVRMRKQKKIIINKDEK